MFRIIRLLVSLVLLGAFLWFGFTVKLGQHTFFGHIGRIWRSDEARDLVKGTREKAGPAARRVKRGIEKGYEEALRDASARRDAVPRRDASPPGGGE